MELFYNIRDVVLQSFIGELSFIKKRRGECTMKISKVVMTAALGVSFALGSQMMNTNTAAAQDVWAYSYSDGGSIYVMSKTILREKYRGYHVTIKDVEKNGSYSKVKLYFDIDEGGWWYKDERSRSMTKVNEPKIQAILNVVLQNAKK